MFCKFPMLILNKIPVLSFHIFLALRVNKICMLTIIKFPTLTLCRIVMLTVSKITIFIKKISCIHGKITVFIHLVVPAVRHSTTRLLATKELYAESL